MAHREIFDEPLEFRALNFLPFYSPPVWKYAHVGLRYVAGTQSFT